MFNRIFKVLHVLFFLLILNSTLKAQSSSALVQRLCNSWKMQKMDNHGTITMQPGAPGDFKLFIKSDSTLLQGLYPEGLIASHWLLDEKNMLLTIMDDKTSMNYQVKIIRITNEELVLQDHSAAQSFIVYYKRDE